MILIAVAGLLGWICAAGALWWVSRLRTTIKRITSAQPQNEVVRRLQQLHTVPTQTTRYVPGTSITRPLGKRINRSSEPS